MHNANCPDYIPVKSGVFALDAALQNREDPLGVV
jgi:hypothetical protein